MNELMILTEKALEDRDKALDKIAERQMFKRFAGGHRWMEAQDKALDAIAERQMFERLAGGDDWMEAQDMLAEQETSDLDEEGFEL